MSWPAKNVVSILYPIVDLHWNQISIEFQLPWKSCSCNGLQVCVYTCFLDSFGFDFNQQAVKFPDLSLIVTPLISSGRRSLQSNKYWIQYVYAIIIAFIPSKARSLNLIMKLSKLCCLNKLDDILHTTYWNVLSLKKIMLLRWNFHWNVQLRVQIATGRHWFRYWFRAAHTRRQSLMIRTNGPYDVNMTQWFQRNFVVKNLE